MDDNFINFKRNVTGAKLEWLKTRLKAENIPFRLKGHSINGHILQVFRDYLADATEIINENMGTVYVGAGDIVWDDLPDNHPIFTEMAKKIANDIVETIAANNEAPAGLASNVVRFSNELQVKMFDVESSNISAIGLVNHEFNAQVDEWDGGPWRFNAIYVRFKGGSYYRYKTPMDATLFKSLINEAVEVARGSSAHSVGSLFHHSVKIYADDGDYVCEKFIEGENYWREVPPKSRRKNA